MSYQSVFDGHHLYTVTWNPPTDVSATANKFSRWVQQARDRRQLPLLGCDCHAGLQRHAHRPRQRLCARPRGCAYHAQTWQAAINSNPDWVIITSFNEWPEGTYIEPSQAYGDRYLGLTAEWAGRFKSGEAIPYTPPVPSAPSPSRGEAQGVWPLPLRGGGREGVAFPHPKLRRRAHSNARAQPAQPTRHGRPAHWTGHCWQRVARHWPAHQRQMVAGLLRRRPTRLGQWRTGATHRANRKVEPGTRHRAHRRTPQPCGRLASLCPKPVFQRRSNREAPETCPPSCICRRFP